MGARLLAPTVASKIADGPLSYYRSQRRAPRSGDRQIAQGWNRLGSDLYILRICLDPDAFIPKCLRRREGRTRTREWIKYDSLSERKNCTYNLSQEGLGLEARMACQRPFRTTGGA